MLLHTSTSRRHLNLSVLGAALGQHVTSGTGLHSFAAPYVSDIITLFVSYCLHMAPLSITRC